ncbi:uncharacterized protein [Manis javanica]|uniref:uncharacterized protein isoform X4 n=1 Tax=Manis javanica TaxID=9974 RepID=UPI000813D46B|nr:uncharacterized protein LOC108401862 isoform X4 [Manis javanica]
MEMGAGESQLVGEEGSLPSARLPPGDHIENFAHYLFTEAVKITKDLKRGLLKQALSLAACPGDQDGGRLLPLRKNKQILAGVLSALALIWVNGPCFSLPCRDGVGRVALAGQPRWCPDTATSQKWQHPVSHPGGAGAGPARKEWPSGEQRGSRRAGAGGATHAGRLSREQLGDKGCAEGRCCRGGALQRQHTSSPEGAYCALAAGRVDRAPGAATRRW